MWFRVHDEASCATRGKLCFAFASGTCNRLGSHVRLCNCTHLSLLETLAVQQQPGCCCCLGYRCLDCRHAQTITARPEPSMLTCKCCCRETQITFGVVQVAPIRLLMTLDLDRSRLVSSISVLGLCCRRLSGDCPIRRWSRLAPRSGTGDPGAGWAGTGRLEDVDPEIHSILVREKTRQVASLELIASEVSVRVRVCARHNQ